MERVIVYAIIYVVEGLIAFYYLNRIFKSKKSKKITFVVYFLTYFFQYIIFFFNIPLLNVCVFFLMNFTLIFLCYSNIFLSSLLHSIIMTVYMCLSEFLLLIILNTLNKMVHFKSDLLNMGYPLVLIFFILNKFLYWLMLYISIKITNLINKNSLINKATILLTIFPIFSFIIFIALHVICSTNSLTRVSQYLLLSVILFLIILNIFIIWLYDYTISQQTAITNLKLEHQHTLDAEHYNKIVTQHDKNQKIMIHDIKNHLQSIYSLTTAKQYDAVQSYISRLLNTTALTKTYEPTNSKQLNLLLARYITICEEKNITFNIYAKSTDLIYLKLEDITAMFCNLIDNAIEASEKMEDAHIYLSIQDSVNKQHSVVTIINSCETPPLTNNKGFVSSKKNTYMHGLGTQSIERVIKKYNGDIYTYFIENEKEFHVVVLLRKNII